MHKLDGLKGIPRMWFTFRHLVDAFAESLSPWTNVLASWLVTNSTEDLKCVSLVPNHPSIYQSTFYCLSRSMWPGGYQDIPRPDGIYSIIPSLYSGLQHGLLPGGILIRWLIHLNLLLSTWRSSSSTKLHILQEQKLLRALVPKHMRTVIRSFYFI